MHLHFSPLLSDWFVYLLFIMLGVAVYSIKRQPHLAITWRNVFTSKVATVSFVVLAFFMSIALLDSIHFNVTTVNAHNQITSTQVKTALDFAIAPLGSQDEKSYSAPFSTHLLSKSIMTDPQGKPVRGYAPLKYAGHHFILASHIKSLDSLVRIIKGIGLGLGFSCLCILLVTFIFSKFNLKTCLQKLASMLSPQQPSAWRVATTTFTVLICLLAVSLQFSYNYHIIGTNQVGQDIFYETLKSVRTGILIGTLTTLFMLPFALLLGTLAGYFSGWIDDVIQYVYTTLSSIPGVLLISAMILVLQVYISNHQNLFPTLIQRADARLLALCFILGITSWANLCRLLRAETLKLREQDYVLAAKSLGVRSLNIIFHHILPNVMHIILITIVLDFSGLVLAEAVLSYVGVGVDPTTMSWGNMINGARLELARQPLVWWPLAAALVFMFVLVLSANLFSDAVRDAFDPKLDHQNARG